MKLQLTKTPGAVIYTRVSGNEQDKHGTSPETQKDLCRRKALALGLPIVAEYYDPAISGGYFLARKGMQAALADIQAGRADTLICANISRYSRDVEHQQAIKKAVRAAGGHLVFCDMTFEDTPAGDLNFTIQGGFAEYERQAIKQRTLGGRIARAKAGLQPSRSRHPFGYRIVGTADVLRGEYSADLIGRYVIVEGEAAAVREMFTRYADGTDTLTGLTRWLNGSGVPCRQRAAYWGISSVAYILKNPVYKGLGVYGRNDHGHDEALLTQPHPHTGLPRKCARFQTPAAPETWITFAVPALVSEETWDAAQARSEENRKHKGGNPRRVRMLAGRVVCPVCGSGLVLKVPSKGNQVKGERTTYLCCREVRHQISVGAHGCTPDRYPVPRVEGDVVASLEDAARRPDIVQEVIRSATAAYQEGPQEGGGGQEELTRVEAALGELEARQAAAVRAQIAGIMAGADPSAYNAVFAEIAQARTDLEARRAHLATAQARRQRPSAASRVTDADFPRILAAVRRVLTSEAIPGEEKRDLIGTVIEKVIPTKEGTRVIFLPGVFGGGKETLQPYLLR